MIVRCAWCKRFKGLKKPFLNCSVTHGICTKCVSKEISNLSTRREVEEVCVSEDKK